MQSPALLRRDRDDTSAMTMKDESRNGDLDLQDHANSGELLGNAKPEDRLRSTRHQHGKQSLPRHLISPPLAFAFVLRTLRAERGGRSSTTFFAISLRLKAQVDDVEQAFSHLLHVAF